VSAVRSRGLVPWLEWRYSLLFPVAVLLVIATMMWSRERASDYLEVEVIDETTGVALDGALVTVGPDTYRTHDGGRIRIDRPGAEVVIHVSADGYASESGAFSDDSASSQTVGLLPATGSDVESTARTGLAPGVVTTEGVTSGVVIPGSQAAGFASGGVLDSVTGASTGTVEVAGLVLDDANEPLQGAVIQSGDALSITGKDGRYVLDGVSDGAKVTIFASGFADGEAEVRAGVVQDVALEPRQIKAIYADMNLMMDPDGLERHIEIANTTEINAIVIDIKDGTILFDSDVPFFEDVGTIQPIFDVGDVLERLKENDIYAIARLVVFQDPLVAEARPDLAVKNAETGDLWRNDLGLAWVSAYEEELWDANVALAVEATGFGFDEIQYDYVRFPSDGDLDTVDFGREYTAESREDAITGFMKMSFEAIHKADGKLAADLFGYVTMVDEEQWIGQRFSRLEPYLDYVCMMIYPSHFTEGNIASAPGHPNDYPYETIYESLERAEALVPGSTRKFRPWLQDFTYYGMREYTAEDVRLQIDAAEDFGASGWMLWGDPMLITVEALAPED
jgi:hypothetical protein